MISIDWVKVEKFPNKKQSVDGKFLLDMRAKVDDLEKQLSVKKQEKVNFLAEIAQLTKDKSALEEKLSKTEKELNEAKSKIAELDSTLNVSSEHSSEFAQEVAEKDEKIKNLEEELKKQTRGYESIKTHYDNIVQEKDKEIENLKNENKEVESLKKKLKESESYLEVKIKGVNKLHDDIKVLEDKLAEAEKAPKILEKIKGSMKLKGFLSDRELDDLLL